MAANWLRKIRRRVSGTHQGLRELYPQYEIGKYAYAGSDLKIRHRRDGANLTIGPFASIGDGVQIYLGGEHRLDWVTAYAFPVLWKEAFGTPGHPHTKGDVHVGADTYLGRESVILSGVTIGDGAVIGTRSIVARDVPPYSIVAGNPARLIRLRFSEDAIARLLELQWWNWDDDKIKRALPLLLSPKVEDFLDAAEQGDI